MEMWYYLLVAAVVFFLSAVMAVFAAKRHSGRFASARPLTVLSLGVAFSAGWLYFPIAASILLPTGCNYFHVVIDTFFYMIKIFAMGGSFQSIAENLTEVSDGVFRMYMLMAAILVLCAPLLTLGWTMTIIRNLSARNRYHGSFYTDAYIFSALNANSLALAEDIRSKDPKGRTVIFTDATAAHPLYSRAKQLGAICFAKPLDAVDFSFHSKKKKLYFFAIDTVESKNTDAAMDVMRRYGNRKNAALYVFTTGITGELLLADAAAKRDAKEVRSCIRVRRIDRIQSLISRTLYDRGYEDIYASAVSENGRHRIGAVVIGMGHCGTEMTRALPWFGQMEGYDLRIDAFDADPKAEERFVSAYPELVACGREPAVDGDAQYTLQIHAGVDATDGAFDRQIAQLPAITYAFISLGDDDRNIAAAVKLRQLCERRGLHPKIHAVLRDAHKKESLTGITNYRGQSYDITFIGDTREFFCEAVILGTDVEKQALERHLKWGSEESFWQYDYNYRSSVAAAIHKKMKLLCKVPGADLPPESRTEAQKRCLRILEHRRWNAYIRSEGYVYGPRNDLAKTHNCLLPFDQLPPEEQEKDDD